MASELTKKETVYRTLIGVVTSVSENKTIHVLIKNMVTHPKYHKKYSVTKKYAVHDEKSIAKLGDKVKFQECRPLSKTKCWRLISIEKTAK